MKEKDTTPQLKYGSVLLDAVSTSGRAKLEEEIYAEYGHTGVAQAMHAEAQERLRYQMGWVPNEKGKIIHYIFPAHSQDFYRYCSKFGIPRGRDEHVRVVWLDRPEDFHATNPRAMYAAPYVHFTHGWYLNPLFDFGGVVRQEYSRDVEQLISNALMWHFENDREIEIEIATGAPVIYEEREPFFRPHAPVLADLFD